MRRARSVIRLVVPLALVAAPTSAGAQTVRIGRPAPDFTLPTLDGRTVHLADFRGHPVIINFWATWCPPCQQEMPQLAAADRAHRAEGLIVLGINGDSENAATIGQFVQKMGIDFPLLLDARSRVSNVYKVIGLPNTVFVDSAGVVRYIVAQPITPELFNRDLLGILSTH